MRALRAGYCIGVVPRLSASAAVACCDACAAQEIRETEKGPTEEKIRPDIALLSA